MIIILLASTAISSAAAYHYYDKWITARRNNKSLTVRVVHAEEEARREKLARFNSSSPVAPPRKPRKAGRWTAPSLSPEDRRTVAFADARLQQQSQARGY